jgi:hypothetical protein
MFPALRSLSPSNRKRNADIERSQWFCTLQKKGGGHTFKNLLPHKKISGRYIKWRWCRSHLINSCERHVGITDGRKQKKCKEKVASRGTVLGKSFNLLLVRGRSRQQHNAICHLYGYPSLYILCENLANGNETFRTTPQQMQLQYMFTSLILCRALHSK